MSCRSHLDLEIDFKDRESPQNRCFPDDRPLHHFKHYATNPHDWTKAVETRADGLEWCDIQVFRCSSSACGAEITIRTKPPRLNPEWVDLLYDKDLIKTRAEHVIAAEPARFEGFAVPPRVDILLHSKHYITNPLFNPEKSKKIQGHNKRFLLSMGEPCAPILEYFGFVREV